MVDVVLYRIRKLRTVALPLKVPGAHLATSIVEPYNTVLCAHSLLEHADFTEMMVHEALYSTCRRNLGIELNRLLAQVMSSLTASLRSMERWMWVALSFRRTWCLTCALLYPLRPCAVISTEKAYHEQFSVAEITMSVFQFPSLGLRAFSTTQNTLRGFSSVPRWGGAVGCQRCDGHGPNEAHHLVSWLVADGLHVRVRLPASRSGVWKRPGNMFGAVCMTHTVFILKRHALLHTIIRSNLDGRFFWFWCHVPYLMFPTLNVPVMNVAIQGECSSSVIWVFAIITPDVPHHPSRHPRLTYLCGIWGK